MGSFETDVKFPIVRQSPLRWVSVVAEAASGFGAAKKGSGPNTWSKNRPNSSHNITQSHAGQHVPQYEVYDAARWKNRGCFRRERCGKIPARGNAANSANEQWTKFCIESEVTKCAGGKVPKVAFAFL